MPADIDSQRKPITFLANAYSVHIRQWLKLAEPLGVEIEIATAQCEQDGAPEGHRVIHLVPRWLKGPSPLRHLWAGLRVRFDRRYCQRTLHAHCTSGNGFIAWLSGRPYIVTTYGSEVLGVRERGPLYAWMIRKVLTGAERITATSQQMADVLQQEYRIPQERIHLFSLGYDESIFHPGDEAAIRRNRAAHGIDEQEPVWLCIKRVVPLSRTIELLRGFFAYCEKQPAGRLVIIFGDDFSDYAAEVKTFIHSSPHRQRVLLVEHWLTMPQMAQWLQLADFGVSITGSDQLSSSVLEAMACASVPVLITIDGYRVLRETNAPVWWIDSVNVDDLATMFASTAAMPRDLLSRRQRANHEYVVARQARGAVRPHLGRLYDLTETDRMLDKKAA